MPFLESINLRPVPLAKEYGFKPTGLAIGNGSQALEIVVAKSSSTPTVSSMRGLWNDRRGQRAVPLLCVILYGDKAAIIGPSGEEPPVHKDLDKDYIEKLCLKALDKPNRHMATRFILDMLPDVETMIPGLRNEGLFATHELSYGVPKRSDWEKANTNSKKVLAKSGTGIITSLGYDIEQTSGPESILRFSGQSSAVALFLNQNESPDAKSERFSNTTPTTYGISRATRNRIPYLLSIKERTLRLYPVESGVGIGNKGLTETYVEVDLDLITEEKAGYLWLIFSGEALAPDGSFDDILERSKDYATDLGERLRQRIYDDVVPDFAEAIARARDLKDPTADELDLTYRMALTLLFRLLFIAYAEDKELLPYRTNENYRNHSLKERARELLDISREGISFTEGYVYWNDVWDLFDAINNSKAEWGVPYYNGGLFSNEEEMSEVGPLLKSIRLSDEVFGPPLTKLLIDESHEGKGPVDFRSLGVREFGTIYEGLLESELSVANTDLSIDDDGYYIPVEDEEQEVIVEEGSIYLHNASGKRKSTGTYFTKSFAVDHLLDHALEVALDEHTNSLNKLNDEEAGQKFFDFRVADIAMGSGHFLVAAIDRIEKRLSNFLAERPLPKVTNELLRLRGEAERKLDRFGENYEIDDNQLLRRQIARHCIFGVDLNPMAVDLAKLSIWIHTFVPGLPLSLLDYNLVQGNSLVGIATIEEAEDILTDEKNPLLSFSAKKLLGDAEEALVKFGGIADANAAEIEQAKKAHQEAMEELKAPMTLLDIFTASRINEDLSERIQQGEAINWVHKMGSLPESDVHKKAKEVLRAVPAFHFPISFPQVFLRENPGFDVILGNPPWEHVKPQEHKFWFRYVPGIRGFSQRKRQQVVQEMHKKRPDLVERFKQERDEELLIQESLTAGDYPGMTTGDPDLYKGFIWRFWKLLREDTGTMGVVLPRSVFNAKGASEFRKAVFRAGIINDLTFLLNNRQWVFEDVHPQYTIALLSMIRAEPTEETTLPLKGPYNNLSDYLEYKDYEPTRFPVSQVFEWTDTAALPLLPSGDSPPVFAQLRKAPRLDFDENSEWRARPSRELDTTNDKTWEKDGKELQLMIFSEKKPKGAWPIYKGESFDIWVVDTGTYYAWADPKIAKARIQAKRERGHKYSNSVFSEFDEEYIKDPSTLACNKSRIAFRKVSRATDSRTIRIAILPPKIFISDAAPFFLWPRGDEKDEAYLLGIMSSIPLDWYARRFVEVNVNYHILNPFPIPRPGRENKLWQRVVHIAGRLGSPDDRFSDWANKVGVDFGAIDPVKKQDMIHELDAVVAHLYGLSEDQLIHIFETFHEGWDYHKRLEETLVHYKNWEQRL